jgi:hypothetical protein
MSNRLKRGRTRPGERPAAWAFAGVAALASSASWSGEAHAQRGEEYTLNEELNVEPSPNDGFPGAFDTQLAKKGAFVANLPTLNLYYGVTDDLSVGTNALTFLPVLSGTLSGSLFARYRLGSTSWFRSTADVMIGGAAGGTDSTFGAALVGSNTEFVLTRGQRLAFNGWYGRIDAAFGDVSLNANVLLLGGTYSLVFARWGAVHLTGLYLTSGSFAIDTPDGTDSLDVRGTDNFVNRILARGVVSLRAGSWLFDVGAVRLGSGVLPWVGISFAVGG